MSELRERLSRALSERYEIERELGIGGMATVYLARDRKHDRQVAVKVLRPELAEALGGERFLREINIAAQIEHPHILTLIDSGEADGLLYYVMPYVDGESLRDRLVRERQLPIRETVRILRDVADGLAEAHRRGLVHRDIKPANIMLSGNHAVVTDFGVAKGVASSTGRHQLTTLGVSLGTPTYMSPEQAAADPTIDHRSDIYALGVVAYEMLVGRPPFTAESTREVLAAHLSIPPEPVRSIRDDVPLPLAELVMGCLEKAPADRWESMEEVLQRLEAMGTPSGGVEPMPRGPARGRISPLRWIPVAAVVLVALTVGVVLQRNAMRTRALVEDLRTAVEEARLDDAYDMLQGSGRSLSESGLGEIAASAGARLTLRSEPPGATVTLTRVSDDLVPGEPVDVGGSPLEDRVLLAGEYLVTLSAPDHQALEWLMSLDAGDSLDVRRTLVPDAWEVPGMVRVDAGPVGGPLASRLDDEVEAFLIGRTEVSNREFAGLVSGGGYRSPELWPDSMFIDGEWRPRGRALERLIDRTGLPGPRQWSAGTFPEGRADHPVTGITWYEAVAFARWSGAELPTAAQWWRAAVGGGDRRFPWGSALTIDQRSNFGMQGTTAVGQYRLGVSPFGAYDMAGNVREWLAGDPGDMRIAVVGGSWQDPTYMFDTPNVETRAPGFDSETVGFRLVRALPQS